ncbi:MAG: copper amine oxidase N-terminal domain-containing protein [Paenibacillus sp.]|nr:copper amine oxidase N-terminal domain-containing protein [Paenibacillus sp.]
MKSKKIIIATMVFGMAITGAAGVYAGSSMEKINAFLNHSIGFTVNGSAYTPVDNKGNSLVPITYRDTTYLPVRALADVLKIPVTYNAATHQVVIGTGTNTGPTSNLEAIEYSTAQKQAILTAFGNFQGFEKAYAPKQMVKGDAFQKVVASDDGVSFLFDHMRVVISPRDYSAGYASQEVQLSNGTKAKWYSPTADNLMLGFSLDDRTVTISSPDKALSKAQMEKVAVSVAKLIQ